MRIGIQLLLCSWLVPWFTAGAIGLSTSFADVVVKQVPLGETFEISSSTHNAFVLWNLHSEPLQVTIVPVVPSAQQLRRGASPIPDPAWVTVVPSSFELPGRAHQACRITLRIPDERRFRGKHFQVMIWSRGSPMNKNGMTFSAGLLSRLRIRTKAKP